MLTLPERNDGGFACPASVVEWCVVFPCPSSGVVWRVVFPALLHLWNDGWVLPWHRIHDSSHVIPPCRDTAQFHRLDSEECPGHFVLFLSSLKKFDLHKPTYQNVRSKWPFSCYLFQFLYVLICHFSVYKRVMFCSLSVYVLNTWYKNICEFLVYFLVYF